MRLIKPLIAICLALFLGCATQIPSLSESNNKGLLLVQSEVSTKDSSNMFISLNFFYSEKKNFSVTPNSKYWISDQLKPGKYSISRMGVYNKTTSNYGGFYDLGNMEFEIKAGHVTIFPAKITTNMTSEGRLSFGLANIEDEDLENIIKYLQSKKSADGWVLQIGNSEIMEIKAN